MDALVETWLDEVRVEGASSSRVLCLIYLLNDVVQSSRERHRDLFLTAFSGAFSSAMEVVRSSCDAGTQKRVRRVVGILKDRGVITPSFCAELLGILDGTGGARAGSGGGGSGRKRAAK